MVAPVASAIFCIRSVLSPLMRTVLSSIFSAFSFTLSSALLASSVILIFTSMPLAAVLLRFSIP